MRDLELPFDGICLAAIHKSSFCTEQLQQKLPMTVNGCIQIFRSLKTAEDIENGFRIFKRLSFQPSWVSQDST